MVVTRMRRKVVRHFLSNLTTAFPSNAVLGYHGTSMEAVKILFKTGSLPGKPIGEGVLTNNYGQRVGGKGSIHFAPRLESLPSYLGQFCADVKKDGIRSRSSIWDAKWYARTNAQHNHFLALAGLDIRKVLHHHAVVELGDFDLRQAKGLFRLDWLKHYRKVIEDLGIDEKGLQSIFREVRQESRYRKGFILVFGTNISSDFKLKPGDSGDDICLSCPQGLDYRYILRAIPQGLREREFLDSSRAFV